MNYQVQHFFDKETYTFSYIIFDKESKDALIIDSVLNYDYAASKISYETVDELEGFVKKNNLELHAILETHAHADHLTGSVELKRRFPAAKVGIGKNITLVQEVFKGVFNLDELATDGSQFDLLIEEDKEYHFGSLTLKAIFTPGHTPACASYLIGEHLFTGDSLFMPDFGTGRCDFPKGDAKELFHSIHEKLYALPDETTFYTGHDYMPNGRELRFMATIGESKKENIHVKTETKVEEFVEFRTTRDKTLNAPKLLLPSIQVNIDAGKLPDPENNNIAYLKIPLTK